MIIKGEELFVVNKFGARGNKQKTFYLELKTLYTNSFKLQTNVFRTVYVRYGYVRQFIYRTFNKNGTQNKV